MALFPAYAPDSVDVVDNANDYTGGEDTVPEALEIQLLASDEEPAEPPVPPAKRPCLTMDEEFYLDTKKDYGNLRVSTLYYPGRPEYQPGDPSRALGAGRGGPRAGRRRQRYWQAGGGGAGGAATGADVAARRAAFRTMLAEAPGDEELWLRYIQFQEEWGAEGGALEAANEAAQRADSQRVRASLHRARARHLAPARLRAALGVDIAGERRASVRRELWARLVEAGGAGGAHDLALAALAHCSADPSAYPHLLYVYGCVVRAAGLWERLAQLVELVALMNYPPSAAFPPPAAALAPAIARAAATAVRLEEQACRSGLPLSAVWARVERARAAAHWRPDTGDDGDGDCDPQRRPPPHAAAELVRPVRGAGDEGAAALCVTLLRLCKVPLLPLSERIARAAPPEPAAGEAATGETLAALLRAARRLPPAHPARPAAPGAARAALAPLLDPPHWFSDAAGFLRWGAALWDACCGWTGGRARLALACWWLRWLHALALLAEPAEAARLRGEARQVLKRHAQQAPIAFVHYARIEACAGAGVRAATHAVRAALRASAGAGLAEAEETQQHALYCARACAELAGAGGEAAAVTWARCCASLRRALPDDDELHAPPPPHLLQAALHQCEERCAAIERQLEGSGGGGDGDGEEEGGEETWEAMLPGEGEWPAMRVALSPPQHRARLLAALLAKRDLYRGARGVSGGRARRYGEQAAVALALAARGAERVGAARALLPLFPRNALLALVCSGEVWVGRDAGGSGGAVAELAPLVPRLLRAPLHGHVDPREAGGVARACARACARGGGGALAHAAWVEAAARAHSPHAERALLAGIAAHPDHKWLYVRGAAWGAGDAAALCDAMLERELRTHALIDELLLVDPAPATAAPPSGTDNDADGDARDARGAATNAAIEQ